MVFALLGVLLSTLSLFFSVVGDARKSEHRITALETKMEVFWDSLTRDLPLLLMSGRDLNFEKILGKMSSPNSPLSVSDSYAAMIFIEEEQQVAKEHKDLAWSLSLILLNARIKVGLVGREQ